LFNYFSEKKRKFDEILGGRESQIEVFQGYLNNFDKYIEKVNWKKIRVLNIFVSFQQKRLIPNWAKKTRNI